MSAAPFVLTACTEETTSEGLYTSLESCIAQTNDSYSCGEAFKQAQAEVEVTAPRYATQEECIAAHGAENCQPRRDAMGHSYFMPLMTGFLVGQMLSNGRTTGLTGAPAFRDRAGNWQRPSATPAGGMYRQGMGGTAMAPISARPDRAPTVSRGGFGSRSGDRGAGA